MRIGKCATFAVNWRLPYAASELHLPAPPWARQCGSSLQKSFKIAILIPSQAHGSRLIFLLSDPKTFSLPCSLRSTSLRNSICLSTTKVPTHNHDSSIAVVTGPPSPSSSSHQQMPSTPSPRRRQQQRQCLPECDVDAHSSRSRDFSP